MKQNCQSIASSVLNKSEIALLSNIPGMLKRQYSITRVARISALLRTRTREDIDTIIIYAQKSDGGWSDTEETIWCAKLLEAFGDEYTSQINRAISWLKSIQHPLGGWGLTSRDMPRIPATGLALTLLPQLATESAFMWLEKEWAKDLQADVKLTYKGGFTLMAFGRNSVQPENPNLIEQTLTYLSAEQNKDGGFGPWKNHPIGSDPWSTGITLVGLTSYPKLADRKVIEQAVEWLCDNQLPSGYWRYHFIDEGSAYAYWGLTEALKYLGEL